jgi:hypothetical protein
MAWQQRRLLVKQSLEVVYLLGSQDIDFFISRQKSSITPAQLSTDLTTNWEGCELVALKTDKEQ